MKNVDFQELLLFFEQNFKKFGAVKTRACRDDLLTDLFFAVQSFDERKGLNLFKYWRETVKIREKREAAQKRYGVEIDDESRFFDVAAQPPDLISQLFQQVELSEKDEDQLELLKNTSKLAKNRKCTMRRAQQIVNSQIVELAANATIGGRPAWQVAREAGFDAPQRAANQQQNLF